jgi:hypothetical protein
MQIVEKHAGSLVKFRIRDRVNAVVMNCSFIIKNFLG